MTREQLEELARLQAAAMAEQTTIAICAYRRALDAMEKEWNA